jgi:hypothetical protein
VLRISTDDALGRMAGATMRDRTAKELEGREGVQGRQFDTGKGEMAAGRVKLAPGPPPVLGLS